MKSGDDTKLYRQALLNMKEEILADSRKVEDGEIDTVNEDLADSVDRSSMEADRNFTIRLLDREHKLLKKVEEAFERLANGEFGVCGECGEDIAKERLLARPVATLCIACKEAEERAEQKIPRIAS